MDDETNRAEELDDEPEAIEAADLSYDAFDEGYIVAVLMGDYIFAPSERRKTREADVSTPRIVATFVLVGAFVLVLFLIAWLSS